MNISIEVEGEEKLDRALRGLAGDTEKAIRLVARPLSDEVYSMVRAQYASRGRRGPTGRAWTRKQSTIDRYTAMNRRGFSVINEPMRRTDALFISETTRGGPHGVYEVEDDSLVMGTRLGYGKIQQDRGQEQYDPTEADIDGFKRIIRRGQVTQIEDRGFDFVEGTGDIPF